MHHLGAGSSGEQRGRACVAEQIEHPRPLGRDRPKPLQHPLPVRMLLGEQSEMPQPLQAAQHGDAIDTDRPALGNRLVETPLALFLVLA